jgi:dipeptidyl aminopeptidase/acylaminoacyl peptidase
MALQGYFIVAINPTGSTGYGQDFTDAIQYNWGGSPYKDLVAGYHAVLDRYAEWIDANRTAALGGSYGGYMINWIQGHNPGFKALVCHDGTFDTTTSRYTTEEVYFLDREFGDPVKNRAVYEKWNPANHVGNWKTPELVIHSANDFRLVNSNGVAAFTALQMKDVTSRYLYFPDENHWVLKPSNSMRWHVSGLSMRLGW